MTIRRRLTASFLAVLVLFAVNEVILVWAAGLRSQTMATVDRALKRQALMSAVRARVSDTHKQMSLLGQIDGGVATGPAGHAALDADIQKTADDISSIAALSDPDQQKEVSELQRTFNELGDAWLRFSDNLGVNPGPALMYQLKAEPLGRKVVMRLLPALQADQARRVDAAENEFAEVNRWTQQVSLGIFVGSLLMAGWIAYRLSRHLRDRLGELNLGAAMIGLMNLDHRIETTSNDELSSVAKSFNHMAENLAKARQELTSANAELTARNEEVERQRHVSESLLLNILPDKIAAELAETGHVTPKYFEDVTILFTDFVGFTQATETFAADELVDVLHGYFKAFDEIAERYGLEKLKTIGDSYFCAGGLPVRSPSHPVDVTLAAFEMIREVEQRVLPDGSQWRVRIGLHTGPVVAGVVGTKKFAFDVWGDTVNRASRMESSGTPNRINVSADTERRIKDFFATECRGLVATKEKTELEMFLVAGVLPALQDTAAVPPAAFARRYKTYFGKDLAAFPAFLAADGQSQPRSAAS